jgi:uncharacterized damage-inducible protein DinB
MRGPLVRILLDTKQLRNMQKKLLQEMIAQNRITCSYALNRISNLNKSYRLTAGTASIGFIYRHIGELMNIFGQFFGVPTDIQNTTMGQIDTGQEFDIETSKFYIEKGYEMLVYLVNNSKDEEWLTTIETPFFGTITRMRLFSHVLFHNSHHTGQISLTLSKGQSLLIEKKLK